jgi:hypothetical protein
MVVDSIVKYMQARGIKQSFVCEKTGLSKQCISQSLGGKRKLALEEYMKICDALCVPYGYFFTEYLYVSES